MEPEKKRGRKKKEPVEIQEPVEKKKRGRKKKWETSSSKHVFNQVEQDTVSFSDNHSSEKQNETHGSHCIPFGNLNITIHSNNDSIDTDQIKNALIGKNIKYSKCKIVISDSEDDYKLEIESNKTKKIDSDNSKKIKTMKVYSDIYSSGKEILSTSIRCMYCHHTFNNKPFFLPYDYNSQLKRYKVTGNFCSPNCVKAYGIESLSFKNKVHLIGQMYRELFSVNFNIRPSPPINTLKCYGGNLSIEEFRSVLYKNKEYILHNINCKIKTIDLTEQKFR